MTTIAWDGRYLAADALSQSGSYRNPEPIQKLRLIDGVAYGITGYAAWFDAWIEWHRSGSDPATRPLTTESPGQTGNFIVVKGGVCMVCRHEMPYFLQAPQPDAWGSGYAYAIGAMLSGKDAREAVEIAAVADINTGGKVTWIDTKTVELGVFA